MDSPTPIKILKPGTFTDIHGKTVTFGAAELAEIVESYDAASDPAPLVIGHPKTDDPAWGWAGALELQGDTIVAMGTDVEPAFAETVRAKRYRKISPSFYPPKHPANPKPGKWYLKHIGFLGAAAPAIKGLGTVSFSDADDGGAITLDFAEENTMPDEQALAEREAALAAREQEIRDKEAAFAQRETQARHDEHVAFAEALIADVKLAPAAKDKVVGLLDQLAVLDVVAFGEGDSAVELAPVDAFKSLFDGAQPIVALGEAAKSEGDDTAAAVSFAAPAGYSFDTGAAQLAVRAQQIQAAEPSLSYWQAFKRAQAEQAS
ncbi:hypothetical protein LZK98_08200 [Sphingomonas cannabina]|uniref:hypothetical protein n=1 Tax=Sphingomonas cannabina TaxID=2899123 RepID=UPI001F188F51|nr:hypothetical protein [Sphingomonas cannabina]UIJ46910.1 hypothetical protein LZK98_08200 [Sphingomonas cannabina]